MYLCMRVPVTIILRCMCQARTVFESCICVWGFLPLFYVDVSAKPWRFSGHVYVYEGSSRYSIKMCVPSQYSVRVMYMCMKVPATILLRCLYQARTMFGSCICVWGFLSLFYYMYVPNQANVRVMYMCKRVPATILLRRMCQARPMFGSCIYVSGFLSLSYLDICAKPGQCLGHV